MISHLRTSPDGPLSGTNLKYVAQMVAGMHSPQAKQLHVSLLVKLKDTIKEEARSKLAACGKEFLDTGELEKIPSLLSILQAIGQQVNLTVDGKDLLERIADRLPGINL